jgi:hypothetical protein
MASRSGGLPPWVVGVLAVLLVGVAAAPLLRSGGWGGTASRPGRADAPAAPAATAAQPAGVRPEELPPITLRIDPVSPAPVERVAFDPAIPDRVVGRTYESLDGGRTWARLPGTATPAGAGATSEATIVRVEDRAGTVYASQAAPFRRPHLMWSAASDGTWQTVPTPGDVRALATDGDRVYAVAEMLGRGRQGAWDWTRWPSHVKPDGVAAHGSLVVAWGSVASSHDGALVVSRDGGATLQVAGMKRPPAWVAIDPHHADELLVVSEDGAAARVRIE